MKKLKNLSLVLLCAVMVLSVTACSDDEVVNDTTYTLIYDMGASYSSLEINITLFEYNDEDEKIKQNTISDIEDGYTEQFKANSNAKRLKYILKYPVGVPIIIDGFSKCII